jgi:PDZ domain-containing protein
MRNQCCMFLIVSVSTACVHSAAPLSTEPPARDSRRPVDGVAFGIVFSERPAHAGAPAAGAYVRFVAPNSPASAADIRHGDSIVAIRGRVVYGSSDAVSALAEVPAGFCVPMEILRASEVIQIPCLRGLEGRAASWDPPRLFSIAEVGAPQLVLVLNTSAIVWESRKLRPITVFDLTDTSVSAVMGTLNLPRDTVYRWCYEVTGPESMRTEQQCSSSDSVNWAALEDRRSCKITGFGKEYQTRQFFRDTSVYALRLLYSIVENRDRVVQDTFFYVVRCDHPEEFAVRMGDRMGREGYVVSGVEDNCMRIVKGESKLLLCVAPGGPKADVPHCERPH